MCLKKYFGFFEDTSDLFSQSKKKSETIDIALDTEYKGREIFSAQVYIPTWNEKIMVFNSKLESRYPKEKSIIESLKSECLSSGNSTHVFFLDLEDDNACNMVTVLEGVAKEKGIVLGAFNVNLLVFFAVNDLFPMFGFNNCVQALLQGSDIREFQEKLYQRNNLKGLLKASLSCGDQICFKIWDSSGLFSKVSLKTCAFSCGIDMSNKNDLDGYKADMSKALLHSDKLVRQSYYKYAMEDAMVLVEIKNRFVLQTNQVLKNLYNFDDRFLFTKDNIPSSVGNLVAKTFQNYIYQLGEKSCPSLDYFRWALCRIGYFSLKSQNLLEKDRKVRKRLIEDASYLTDKTFPKSHLSDNTYLFNALSLGSVYALLSAKPHTMLSSSATVTGGRCVNERYQENVFKNVFDIDFTSCYGSCLKDLSFPIGKPKIYACSVNKKGMQLKEFLGRNRSDFVDSLWKIVVSGDLGFSQDLVYSKVLSNQNIARVRKSILKNEFSTFENEHVLIKDKIFCGVITCDILELIEKVSSSLELKGWMNLSVESAVWYPKSKRISCLSEWSRKIVTTQSSCEKVLDFWTEIPLGGFINPLLEARKEYKDLYKSYSKIGNKALSSEYFAKNNSAKLFVNTLYGCLASPFFKISNTIVADNITSKPRCQVWMASKALNGIQSITDGFCYQPERINILTSNKKKPGFGSFSSLYILKRHKSIKKSRFLERDWKEIFAKKQLLESDYNFFNEQIRESINTFWKNYDLSISFDIEHKSEHTSHTMATWSKAHYMLKCLDGKTITKTRGTDKAGLELNDKSSFSPLHEFLENFCNGLDAFPENMSFMKKKRIGINECKTKYQKNSDTSFRPGDYVETESLLKFNCLHLPCHDLAVHKKRCNFVNRKDCLSYEKKNNCKTPSAMIRHMLKA